jgi:hypothetical protein
MDNRSFKAIGNDLHMRFNLRIFTGNMFCLFNYARAETGGVIMLFLEFSCSSAADLGTEG